MSRRLIAAVAVAALMPSSAAAAPPPNDTAAGAGVFAPYSSSGGTPRQQEAVAELREAGPDPGVPSCLGPGSFARTVWYRVPAAETTTELTVEAVGNTLDVLDLAAFVQPAPPPPAPLTSEPNACAGAGAGGADAAEEPTSAVTLHVPAGRDVLFQVGRRGPVGSTSAERALLSLDTQLRVPLGPPSGDQAGSVTERLTGSGDNVVDLAGATITEEDPGTAECPSLGTVWRRLVPGSTGERLIEVRGSDASTFTVFSGRQPARGNYVDCVTRERSGAMQMLVPVQRNRTVWVRIGTGRTTGGETATVNVLPGDKATVIDGGRGGFDPTPYGAGGGLPEDCEKANPAEASFAGRRLRGRAGAFNRFKRVPLRFRLTGSVVCDVELRLFGPRGRVYAKGRAVRLLRGRRVTGLARLATFVPGRYRLRIKAVDELGKRIWIAGTVAGRLKRK